MSEAQFCQQHESIWLALEQALQAQSDSHLHITAYHYREIGQHYALARQRCYSPQLIQRLRRLVLELHWRLQVPRQSWVQPLLAFLARGFPQALRRQWRWLVFSAVLFYLPLFGTAFWLGLQPHYTPLFIDAEQRQHLADSYRPQSESAGHRDARSDWQMFGYYIRNNTGIGFRTFASGLIFGLGSIAILLFNGSYIGAASGYVIALGYGPQFLPFVAGHSALELSAIVICGAAGMALGFRLLDPGHHSRQQALALAAREWIPVVMGAALMFFAAAFIEAFWSSRSLLPAEIRYGVGLLFWLLLAVYVWRAGRSSS